MIKFDKAKILHTHLLNGAINCTETFIKNNNLYLLDGYKTVNKNNTVQELFFNKGWYNNKLEFIAEITTQDQNEINDCLIF